jgi:putative Mg2+ transporter-C (MgtC) family protein
MPHAAPTVLAAAGQGWKQLGELGLAFVLSTFIGGGLIFVRGDIVRGLITAAIVWVTAAVGMACGAGLALLACATTAGHFAVVLGYPAISARLPASRPFGFAVRVVYEDGRGILRDVLAEATRRGFAVQRVTAHRLEARAVGACRRSRSRSTSTGSPASRASSPRSTSCPACSR